MKKFEAQQARRVLDRIVGYQISPVLWTKVRRGLSAGRVQSVAVRIIAEREAEITAFQPQEYWTVETTVEGGAPPPFTAKFSKLDGKKVELTNEGSAREVVDAIKGSPLVVSKVERKERRKNAPPPFITSKLQQEGSSKLRFSPKRTMGLVQRLYEGVEVGEDGLVGLITYMRTDSTRLSDDAIADVRAYIGGRFGADRPPAEPIVFKTKKGAQDAHEAIRPTSTKYDPETVRKLWAAGQGGGGRDERETDDLLRLYTLIWNRTIACQMVPAVFDQTSVDIAAGAGRAELRASGQVMKFAGFLEVYAETVEDAANEDETSALPEVREGDAQAPRDAARAALHAAAAAFFRGDARQGARGEGHRPAVDLRGDPHDDPGTRLCREEGGPAPSNRAGRHGRRAAPQELPRHRELRLHGADGRAARQGFEEGDADWVKILKDFYGPFKGEVETAKKEMRDIKREEQATDEVCEKCGRPMVIKWGRNGHFLACSGYPECRNTKEHVKNEDGTITTSTTRPSDMKCPTCGADMVIRRGRFGEFQACTKYPECKTTAPMSLGVTCPKEGCGGYLTEKRSKRGKVFFGCSNYQRTKCDFVSWDRPLNQPCPKCGKPFLLQKVSKGRHAHLLRGQGRLRPPGRRRRGRRGHRGWRGRREDRWRAAAERGVGHPHAAARARSPSRRRVRTMWPAIAQATKTVGSQTKGAVPTQVFSRSGRRAEGVQDRRRGDGDGADRGEQRDADDVPRDDEPAGRAAGDDERGDDERAFAPVTMSKL